MLDGYPEDPRLSVLDIQTGSRQEVFRNAEGIFSDPQWSPDGQWIGFETREYLHLVQVPLGAGTAHYLIPDDMLHKQIDDPWAWAPDSQQLLIVGKGADSSKAIIYRASRDGADWLPLAKVPGMALGTVRWPTPGTLAYFTSYDRSWQHVQEAHPDSGLAGARPFELYAVDIATGEVSRLTDVATHGYIWWPQWSPDGQTIVYQSELDMRNEIWLTDTDGTNPRPLFQDADDIYAISGHWASDGERILFEQLFYYQSPYGDYTTREISSVSAVGTDLRRLTDNVFSDWSPVWLP